MAIATVDNLREYLDQLDAGATMDGRLTNILTRAESIVAGALGFDFFPSGTGWDDIAATTRRVRSEKSMYLKLPPYQYGSITSLVAMSGTTAGTTEVTDYEETEEKFYLYREGGWGGTRYQVAAKYGYGPAPASIVQLILEITVNTWRGRDQGSFQTSQGVDTLQNAVGGGYLKYIGGLNTDQRRIVANVRRQYIEAIH